MKWEQETAGQSVRKHIATGPTAGARRLLPSDSNQGQVKCTDLDSYLKQHKPEKNIF